MTERPIIFNTEMVKAILDGRKTQTRRVIKPQPVIGNGVWYFDDYVFFSTEDLKDYLFHDVYGVKGSPYGSVYGDGTADTLWVRETWQAQTPAGNWWHEIKKSRELYNWAVIYKATWEGEPPPRWIPSIFMPRWASRIKLRVENVRVERVQDITPEDCFLEGVIPSIIKEPIDPIGEFYKLWDSINTKRGYGWQVNPWVWAVEFAPHCGNSEQGASLDGRIW